MAQDSLIRFSNAIISDAEKKRSNYMQKLKKDNEELIKNKEIEYKAEYEKHIADECAKADNEYGLAISKKRNELKRGLIMRRSEMFDEVFAAVTANISAYAETDEYRKNIVSEFETAVDGIGKGALECAARECDISTLKASAKAANVTFAEPEGAILGGFTLRNRAANLFTDCTLDAKIAEQKEQFVIKSGLTIE